MKIKLILTSFFLFFTLEPMQAQEPLTIFMRPANTGNMEYDAFKNEAFDLYEFSVTVEKKALKTKILTSNELESIKYQKAVADSLLAQSEILLKKLDSISKNQPNAPVFLNTQQAIIVLNKAKSNFRIAVAVLEEMEEIEEF